MLVDQDRFKPGLFQGPGRAQPGRASADNEYFRVWHSFLPTQMLQRGLQNAVFVPDERQPV